MATRIRRVFSRFLRFLRFTFKFRGLHRINLSFLCLVALVVVFQVVFVSRILVKRNSRSSEHLPTSEVGTTSLAPVLWSRITRKNNTINAESSDLSTTPALSPTKNLIFKNHGKNNRIGLPKQNRNITISKVFRNKSTAAPTLDYRMLHEYYPPVNFSIIEPHVEPKIDEKEIFLLILINSGTPRQPNAERRKAIRKTWANMEMSNVPSYSSSVKHGFPFKTIISRNFKLVFLLGKSGNEALDAEIEEEAKKYNDIVIGNFEDIYVNLVIKVFMGFKWAAKLNCRYILKGDDDTYIYLPRLISILEGVPSRFFGGYVVINGNVFRNVGDKHAISKKYYKDRYYPPYCEGAFYVFSFNLIPEFLRLTKKFRPFHVEDAYLGILLREMEVQPLFMPGFHISNWMFGNIYNFYPCQWATAIALGHKFNTSHIEYAHSQFTMVDPSKLTEKEWRVCNHKSNTITSNNLLPALYGMLISLALILIYITVAFLPSQDEYEDHLHFHYQRRHYYPYVYRAGQ